ncbi:MAG: hypothetical protein BA863_03750 [Desulfovibrio sp. S3730MH75]|nr:MAG: hypothetical protein BA863_03750 [Desulfovibrio sp. S3730MH75]
MDEKLKKLLREEEELQFASFNEDTAWQIGSQLVQESINRNLPVTIDITHGERQLFHASRPGASADNDEWIKRKVRLVYRFGHSSFYMGQFLKSRGKCIEEMYLLPESEYAPHGGCFPIIIISSGVIGTITVSGLTQEEDHKLVVQAIKDYLHQNG